MNRLHPPSKSVETLILGAGLTGLSAAYQLGNRAFVAEACEELSGTAGSLRHQGFYLDRGIHILYFRDPEIRRWIVEDLQVPLEEHSRRCAVLMGGRLVPFPIQFNLGTLAWSQRWRLGLPTLAASVCSSQCKESVHMNQWSRRHFGGALTREFFRPYNEKLWGVPLEQLGTQWMEGYLPPPSLRAVFLGLCSRNAEQYGGNARFWYPQTGGMIKIAQALARKGPEIHLNMRLTSLDLERKVARFSNGEEISYGRLISTIPLTNLIKSIEPAIPELSQHATALHCNSLTIAHFLLSRPGIGEGLHWMYVPDSTVPFYRITFPHNITSANCPQGRSAITLEFGREVLDRAQTRKESMDALIRMGLVHHSERESEVLWDEVAHGYVTYDDDWATTRQAILSLLRKHDVICLGRYGRWEYSNMESALLQGREIHRRLIPCRSAKALAKNEPRTISSPTHRYFYKKYPHRSGGLISCGFRRGESDRLRIVRSWVPHCEGLEILDAGCGDGIFLHSLLQGTALRIRLEDFVSSRVAEATKRLVAKADVVEGVINDLRHFSDSTLYDIVFAFGVFDYEADWPSLLDCLFKRTRGMLIADFPRLGTFHNVLRKCWLRLHDIRLQSSNKANICRLLSQLGGRVEIVDSPLHWLVKLQK